MNSMLYGMQIVESALAVTLAGGKLLPVKQWHRKGGYAQRVAKKWAKKHGPLTYKPCAYQMRDPMTGQPVLIVHPAIAAKLRSAR